MKKFLISCLILSSCLSKEPVKEIVVKESKVEVERITFGKGNEAAHEKRTKTLTTF
jgi:hypothetical protein